MRLIRYCILLIISVLFGEGVAVSQTLDITTPFYQKIVSEGFDSLTVIDLSSESMIAIDEPRCAYVNITEIEAMPIEKNDDMHAWFECYDGNGNYFKKKIILNAQGNSSLVFVKKNFAVDFCEDDWEGDETADFSIGKWVTQDAFHFKAYYTDYFRGIATIGYKLFDDVVADHDSYLERAGLEKIDRKARCYPDGFPCIVYLNGEYYGIFAWQLKKHRKNTGQKKDNPNHIHIDGTFDGATFWIGTVDWTNIEVRNPKNLISATIKAIPRYEYVEITDSTELSQMNDSCCVETFVPLKDLNTEELTDTSQQYYKFVATEGDTLYYKLAKFAEYKQAEYKGDEPSELVDEKSEYYDASDPDHVRTAAVKRTILRASGYWDELSALERSGADSLAMRSAIAERYDIVGIVDYVVFSLVTSNYDGFRKNWQWLTYDGVKWFLTPYDLDGIFGNVWTGTFIMPADWSWINDDYRMSGLIGNGPTYWVMTYYWQDIVDRYCELRSRGVFSVEHIMQYVNDWSSRVGEEAYDMEKHKWADSYCYNELVLNPNWQSVEDWTDYYSFADYEDSLTYNVGDTCRSDYRLWVATGTTTGVKPYLRFGYIDDASRVEKWITDRLALEDSYLGYDAPEQETRVSTLSSESVAGIEGIYNASGVRVRNIRRGLNLIRYKNGDTKKVFR